ncbi:M23 family metallopeptidase [uncultured Sphingomonas sp.]|uniref:M23 family metallopeptidase n=1 Tax=uncultured Sphingomonas sp. TaxID=158754 RepID=UPI0025FAE665|nr:M23 family metallopeptidase [uncultured Sphingomonas sp.]
MRIAFSVGLLLACTACIPRPEAKPAPVAMAPVSQPVAPPPPQVVAPSIFGLDRQPEQGALLKGMVPLGTSLLLLDGKPVRFAPDGTFIIGFERDAQPNAVLEARMQNGRLLRLPLTVSPHAWDISELKTLSRGTSPSAAYQRIRSAELAQIETARAANVDSDGWRQCFQWPAVGRISTLFGSQRIYAGGVRGAYHGGLDIARAVGGQDITGTPALAPADGVVVLATDNPFSLEGNLVMIDHGFGLVSAMMHLQRIQVRTGQRISRGQPIGTIGMTGRATGPHLHWGMTWNGLRIDPLFLVGPMPGT